VLNNKRGGVFGVWMQAIRAAKESVVMLDNKDGVLPLDAKKIKKLLVLGPNADEVRTGDYSAAGWVRRHNIIMQYNMYICNIIMQYYIYLQYDNIWEGFNVAFVSSLSW
jgi:beta-glucosidase-like glycosyl hydrolase